MRQGRGAGIAVAMEDGAHDTADGSATDDRNSRSARMLGAFAAFNAIVVLTVGTFAVHGLRDPQARDWVMTGVLFQLPHVPAVFAIMAWRPGALARGGAWAIAIGSLVFAGVLYVLAMGAPRFIAVFGTIGGTLMMLGWCWIALLALAGDRLEKLLRRR